jgi:hypothetical protein
MTHSVNISFLIGCVMGIILTGFSSLTAQELPKPGMSALHPEGSGGTAAGDLDASERAASANLANNDAAASAVRDVSNEPGWLQDFLSQKLPFSFGLVLNETYDDNIFISPQKSADFVTQIQPGVLFILGDKTMPNMDYLRIAFSPDGLIYADHPDQNTVDYDADLLYQHSWTRLTVGLEQRYQKLSTATIDVGDLVRRDVYTTLLTASYAYNDDLNFYATGTQRISDYQASVPNTNEWIGDVYGLYQLTPKLGIGFGPRIGFVDIAGAANQNYEEALGHLNYELTGKIFLTFSGGGEYLSYQDNTPSRLLPVFEFSANYQPFDGTNLAVSAYRESIPSYDEIGENYLNTVIQASLKQRFLRNWYLVLSGGYDIADYQFASQTAPAASGPRRDDHYYFAEGGVEWDPNDWLKLTARYQFSEDNSTFSENSFSDNQINLQSTAEF